MFNDAGKNHLIDFGLGEEDEQAGGFWGVGENGQDLWIEDPPGLTEEELQLLSLEDDEEDDEEDDDKDDEEDDDKDDEEDQEDWEDE